MKLDKVELTLKEIKKGPTRGLLSEMLFDNGIVVKEMHEEYFFENCVYGRFYQVVLEEDVVIRFRYNEDEDDYSMLVVQDWHGDPDDEIELDRYTKEAFENFIKKEIQ